MDTNITQQATDAVRQNIADNPTFDLEGIATLSYFDGYMAGHKAAMREAQKIADEVFSA